MMLYDVKQHYCLYRLNIATLKRCEDVLQKLHEKVEKVCFVQRRSVCTFLHSETLLMNLIYCMKIQLYSLLSLYNTSMLFLQGTNAQAKHATMKPAEEKRTTNNSQESANSGSSDTVSSVDGKYVENFLNYMRFLSINII